MHLLEPANDGIDWARFDTDRAANTASLVNNCHLEWPFDTVLGVQWNDRLTGKIGQQGDSLSTTWWALIDRSLTAGNRFRIRAAGRIAATRALGLR